MPFIPRGVRATHPLFLRTAAASIFRVALLNCSSPSLAPRLLERTARSLSRLVMDPSAAAGKATAAPRETGAQKRIDYTGLPKVELHLHMDGACRMSTLRELSRQQNLDYPHDDEEAFAEYVKLLSPAPSLADFLKVFGSINKIVRTREAVERVTYEYCEELKRQNVLYFECRYNPLLGEGDPEECIEGVIAGLERGERDFGVKSRQIFGFMRDYPELSPRLIELALKYRTRGVVGVDIAGNELLPLHPLHRAGLHTARASGLHITMHAGESGPPENVRQAIEEFGAERIGHGYRVLEDPAVYQLARQRNVHFEACLTSSIYTNAQQSFRSHAVKRWALDGTSFSLSTDDPGVIGNDILTEYRVASEEVGLTKDQIVKSVLDGVAACFLPDNEKQQLLGRVKEGIAEWEKSIS